MIEKVTGLIGMIILNAFLLGLAGSINETPFWVIVVMVLSMGWYAWYDETIKHSPDNFKD